jgi:hypothetical protein
MMFEKVRNFLRSTVQEVAQLAAGHVYYDLQQCMHRFIHILVRKKLRSWVKATKGEIP